MGVNISTVNLICTVLSCYWLPTPVQPYTYRSSAASCCLVSRLWNGLSNHATRFDSDGLGTCCSRGLVALRGSRLSQGSNGSGFGTGKLSPKTSSELRPRDRQDKDNVKVAGERRMGAVAVEKYCPTLNMSYPGLKVLHNDPLVLEIDSFFDDRLCDEYIARAVERGERYSSQTFAANTATQRTSTTWYLKYDQVPEFLLKANQLTNKLIETYEEPQVVKYELGQQFSWHYDALPASLNKNGGQRVATLIVYLNSVATGGATAFKDLKLQVRPVKGKALLFFPCTADGTPDDRTMHAGQVAGDTKWIAQL